MKKTKFEPLKSDWGHIVVDVYMTNFEIFTQENIVIYVGVCWLKVVIFLCQRCVKSIANHPKFGRLCNLQL